MSSSSVTKLLLLTLGGASALGLGVSLWRANGRTAVLASEVTDLRARLERLEHDRQAEELARRKVLADVTKIAATSGQAAGEAAARAARAPALPAATPPVPSPAVTSPAMDGEALGVEARSAKAARAQRDAYLARLDEAVDTSPADPSWSVPALRDAEAAVTRALRGARILEQRCGQDMCRIVVEHGPASEDGTSAEAALMQEAPFNSGGTILHLAGSGAERPRSRIYLPRAVRPPGS